MTVLPLSQSEPMKRCEEVREILLEILREGLLRIRVAGWAGRSEDCANEADHLHNLPWIIQECSLKPVRSYYEIARPAFTRMASNVSKPELFEPQWERLRAILIEAEPENTKH